MNRVEQSADLGLAAAFDDIDADEGHEVRESVR